MAIATKEQYWGSRLNGENPALPVTPVGFSNIAWTLSSGSSGQGSASDGWWIINATSGGQYWASDLTVSGNYTITTTLKFSTAPNNGEVLMAIDNGSHRVEVRSKGTNAKLDLVGATTVTTHDLDLDMGDDDAVPVILRLTLDSSGNARLYMREIIEDDDGATHYLSVTGSSSSSSGAFFGNTTGNVSWASVYTTNDGAFSPDELATSDWAQDTLIRAGLSIVNLLRDSNRVYLKTHVSDSSIIYGYDISSKMLGRLRPPTIHVITRRIDSPEFTVLGGARVDQNYEITIYITTRGTNYKNAYRLALSIAGEVFDEIYTNTGLDGNTDSITNYSAELDSKLDDDEVICVHILNFDYMKKINMRRR